MISGGAMRSVRRSPPAVRTTSARRRPDRGMCRRLECTTMQEHDIADGGLRPVQFRPRTVHRSRVEVGWAEHVGGGAISPLFVQRNAGRSFSATIPAQRPVPARNRGSVRFTRFPTVPRVSPRQSSARAPYGCPKPASTAKPQRRPFRTGLHRCRTDGAEPRTPPPPATRKRRGSRPGTVRLIPRTRPRPLAQRSHLRRRRLCTRSVPACRDPMAWSSPQPGMQARSACKSGIRRHAVRPVPVWPPERSPPTLPMIRAAAFRKGARARRARAVFLRTGNRSAPKSGIARTLPHIGRVRGSHLGEQPDRIPAERQVVDDMGL